MTLYQCGYMMGYQDGRTGRLTPPARVEEACVWAGVSRDRLSEEGRSDLWLGYWYGKDHGSGGMAGEGARARGEIPDLGDK